VRLSLLAVFALALPACPPAPTPPPNPPDASDSSAPAPPQPPAPAADSGVVLTPDCVAAQANLLKLQCKDARGRLLGGPNEHGTPFAAVCTDDFGKGIDIHAKCLAAASSCAGASSCSL